MLDISIWILTALGASFLTIAVSCCVVSGKMSRLEEEINERD